MADSGISDDQARTMTPEPAAGAGTKKKSVLTRIGHGIKNSPKMVRKAMGKVQKRLAVGKSKENSSLTNCQDNGWLYKDAEVTKGINYKVKYLGSVEVEYDPASTEANQENAQKAMRAIYSHAKDSGAKGKAKHMALSVSVDNIVLASIEGSKTVMRHSTTRIAYSTVDTGKPKVFSYVAVVKNTQLALCHVFRCKTAKQGYEMTFVCAQAFDMNYRRWREDADKAKAIADAGEDTDIEPTQAWQRKKTPEELAAAAAAAAAEEGGDAPADSGPDPGQTGDYKNPSPLPADHADPVLPTPTMAAAAAARSPAPQLKPEKKIFLAIQGGQDPADIAGAYFASLGVNMIEDDDDDTAPINAGGMLQMNVDTEAYNAAAQGDDADDSAGGYMTVGNFDFAADDDDDDSDGEL